MWRMNLKDKKIDIINGGDDCGQYLVLIDLWCAELNWDNGDCEALGRTTQRIFNKRVPIGQ